MVALNSYAQQLKIELFNESNGFNRKSVNDIKRDKNGDFWLATEKGIIRFDGVNFIDIHSKYLSKKPVSKLHLHQNNLYIIYKNGGCDRLNVDDYSVTKITDSSVSDVLVSGNKFYTLQTNGLLILFHQNHKTILQKFQVFNDLNVLISWQNKILVGIPRQGVYVYDDRHPKLFHKIATDYKGVNVEFEPKGDTLFTSINHDVYIIDKTLKPKLFLTGFSKNRLDFKDVFKFISDSLQYYFLNNKYLFKIDHDKHQEILVEKMKNIALTAMYANDPKFLVVGTSQGLIVLKEEDKISVEIDDNYYTANNFINIRRKIIPWGKDKILLLGNPFIFEYMPNGIFKKINRQFFTSYDGLVYENKLYLCTEGQGLVVLDLNTGNDVVMENFPFETFRNSYSVIHDTLHKSLIFGGLDAIGIYNLQSHTTATIQLNNSESTIKNILFEPTQKQFWVSNEKALLVLDSNFKLVKEFSERSCHLELKNIGDLKIQKKTGFLWVAHENGVIVIDPRNFKIQFSLSSSEFTNPRIVALLEDQQGRMWMSSYEGIFGYDTHTKEWIKLVKKNNLINTEYNYKSAAMLQDGRLIFGGLNGYDIINPYFFNFQVIEKKGKVSGYEIISSNDTLFYHPNKKEETEISFNSSNEILTIFLSVENEPLAVKYNFEYSFDGESWIKINDPAKITINKILPNNYLLNIRAFDQYGRRIKFNPLKLNARVDFFKSTTFIVLTFSSILLLMFLLLLVNAKRNEQEKKIRENISMDLHDEVGTTLTRALYLAEEDKLHKNNELLTSYLKESLYSLRLYINTINKSQMDLPSLVIHIRELSSRILDPFEFKVVSNINQEDISTITAELYRDVELCIYEIFTNIKKYSNASFITINIDYSFNRLAVKIEDNGTLVDLRLLENKGRGVTNLRKRTKKHQGQTSFSISNSGHGLITNLSFQIENFI